MAEHKEVSVKIESPAGHIYEIGRLVRESPKFRIYLCTQVETGRQCLLQIAKDVVFNGDLERNAFILKELKRLSDELEVKYDKVKTDPKSVLNYDLGFPQVVEGFNCVNQGNRRVNILAFRCIEDYRNIVPLPYITEKDGLRVDPRTSAWIMGKALKLLTFLHSQNYSIKNANAINMLLVPEYHYVLFFDMSEAILCVDGVPDEDRKLEIAQAAQAVIQVLDGDIESGIFPDSNDASSTEYFDYLLYLARGNHRDAQSAHKRFYEIVDSLWVKEFYPFTTYPL